MATPVDGVPLTAHVLRSVRSGSRHPEGRHRSVESESCHRVQLALRFGWIRCFVITGSPATRQPAFAARHQARYPASYTRPTRLEGPVTTAPLSCCLSAAGIRFLGVLFP